MSTSLTFDAPLSCQRTPDTFSLLLYLENPWNCTNVHSLTGVQVPRPQGPPSDTFFLCEGSARTLFLAGPSICFWDYLVYPQEGVVRRDTSRVVFRPNTSRTYTVQFITDTSVCPADMQIYTFWVSAPRVSSLIPEDTILPPGTSIWVSLDTFQEDQSVWVWKLGDSIVVLDSLPWMPALHVQIPDIYGWQDTIWLYARDAFGCLWDTFLVLRTFPESCVDHIWIPNAFTPNGDGVNDYLHVYALRPAYVISWEIFSRWGERVFHAEHFPVGWPWLASPVFWDGTFRGKVLSPDVFVYVLQVQCPEGEFIIKGDVTLLR